MGDETFVGAALTHLQTVLAFPNPIVFDVYSGRSIIRIAADLELAAEDLDGAARRYDEARAWAEREGARMELGRVEHGMARLRLAEDQPELAAAHCDRAIETFGAIGASLYLDQARALSDQLRAAAAPLQRGRDGLSGREVEVLRLVARGNTNRQIASRLEIAHAPWITTSQASLEKQASAIGQRQPLMQSLAVFSNPATVISIVPTPDPDFLR